MSSPDNRSPARQEGDLERRLHARYRAASDALDPITAGRLQAARRTALHAAQAPARARTLQRALLPAGAFAVIALATLMIWQPRARHETGPAARVAASVLPAQDADSDLPPDPDSTDPKLYQNLDFYDWLAANDSGKGTR